MIDAAPLTRCAWRRCRRRRRLAMRTRALVWSRSAVAQRSGHRRVSSRTGDRRRHRRTPRAVARATSPAAAAILMRRRRVGVRGADRSATGTARVDSTSHTVIAHSAVAPATWIPTRSGRHLVEVLHVARRPPAAGRRRSTTTAVPAAGPAITGRPSHEQGEGDGEWRRRSSRWSRGPVRRRRCRRRSAARPRRRRAVRRR